jgi:hypothetical protein
MNVGIGTVAAQFLFWEYLFRIFGIVSLQFPCYNIFKTYLSLLHESTQRDLMDSK